MPLKEMIYHVELWQKAIIIAETSKMRSLDLHNKEWFSSPNINKESTKQVTRNLQMKMFVHLQKVK